MRISAVVDLQRMTSLLGGPPGRRAKDLGWLVWPILILITLSSMGLGILQKQHCRDRGWSTPDQFVHACYSDLPVIYQVTGISTGAVPYLNAEPERSMDQPVLTGLTLWALAKIVPKDSYGPRYFFDLAAVLIAILALTLVLTVQASSGSGLKVGLLVAASPLLALTSLVSLDLLGVSLATLGLWAWSRNKPNLAGFLIGLAISARTYPIIFLIVLGLLALRSGVLMSWARAVLAAGLTVLLLLAPWLALNPAGIRSGYRGWVTSSPGYGSLWLAPQLASGGDLRIGPTIATAAAIAGILAAIGYGAWLAFTSECRPPLAKLIFVVLALIVISGKAWPVQTSLWLLPLAALAWPKVRDHLIWWTAEVLYFISVWQNIVGSSRADRGLPSELAVAFLFLRVFAVLWLVWQVVADIRQPDRDPALTTTSGGSDPLAGLLANATPRANGAAEDSPNYSRKTDPLP